jgi:hypothetical protein
MPQAYLRQRSLFLRQVLGVSQLPLLKQYLLLYSAISLPKLAALLETDEGALRTALTCLKKNNYWWVGARRKLRTDLGRVGACACCVCMYVYRAAAWGSGIQAGCRCLQPDRTAEACTQQHQGNQSVLLCWDIRSHRNKL